MSAMTSSGVPPAPIFESLSKEKNISKVVAEEATRINRDIEILGLDVLKALEQAAYRSPSERWANFLEGIIATVTSGGDLIRNNSRNIHGSWCSRPIILCSYDCYIIYLK